MWRSISKTRISGSDQMVRWREAHKPVSIKFTGCWDEFKSHPSNHLARGIQGKDGFITGILIADSRSGRSWHACTQTSRTYPCWLALPWAVIWGLQNHRYIHRWDLPHILTIIPPTCKSWKNGMPAYQVHQRSSRISILAEIKNKEQGNKNRSQFINRGASYMQARHFFR